MAVQIIADPLCVTARLEGEIDHHTAPAMRRRIDEAILKQKPSLLRLDFDGVQFMDSSGVGLVMGRYRCITELGGKLEVVNLSDAYYRIMRLSGIETLAKMQKKEEN